MPRTFHFAGPYKERCQAYCNRWIADLARAEPDSGPVRLGLCGQIEFPDHRQSLIPKGEAMRIPVEPHIAAAALIKLVCQAVAKNS